MAKHTTRNPLPSRTMGARELTLCSIPELVRDAHQDALNGSAQHRGSSHQGLGMLSLGTDDAAEPGRRDDMDTFAERGLEREPALLEVGR